MIVAAAGGHAGFLSGQIVYLGGTTWRNGCKEWLAHSQVYDLGTGEWRFGEMLPGPLAYAATARFADRLELYGGSDIDGPRQDCWCIESGAVEFHQLGQLPAPLMYSRTEVVEGASYLFGGCADPKAAMEGTDAVYCRESGVWRKISVLPQGALVLAASACVGSRVFLFGGRDAATGGSGRDLDDAFMFDAHSLAWQRLRPLSGSRRGLSAIALDNRYILLMGGHSALLGEFDAAVHLYDIETDKYSRPSPLPSGVMCVDLFSNGNEIYAAGGEVRSRGRSGQLLSALIPDLLHADCYV